MPEAPVKGARAKRKVAEVLALRILGGTYPAGAQLPNEAALLGEFLVSRTCLREALQMLGAKGLVYSRAKAGTFVHEQLRWNFLDADLLHWRQSVIGKSVFLRELIVVRRMVEPETAALAARNIDPPMLLKLQAALLDMARGNGAYTALTVEADVAFHRLLLAASGNALLSGLGACIEKSLRESISITSHPKFANSFALDKHIALYEAVRDGDAAGARRRMIAILDLTSESLDRADYGEGIDGPAADSGL